MKKVLATMALAGVTLLPSLASADVVYNAIPSTLAPNYPSQPFQAQQTSEFGDYVHLAGTARSLTTVTMTMSDWALAATPANVTFCATAGNCDGTGFFWPITVNIYSNHLGLNDSPDILLATKTQTVHVPWRPVSDDCGGDPTAYTGTDNSCNHGLAFNASFDLSSLNISLPNDVIVGFVYNTQTYGPDPTGIDGPYNSLNIAVPNNNPVTIGTDDSTDQVFWNTQTVSDYSNPLCTGSTFCEDMHWTPNGTVAIQIGAITPVVLPVNTEQCKNDGWKNFTNPTFKNQGQCVSSVVSNSSHK